MEHIDELLAKLTLATGIGYAGNVKNVIHDELQRLQIKGTIEKDGSVSGYLKGRTDCGIMIACHIDEVGFMVSSIDDAGRLSLSSVGGIDISILPAQQVMVHGRKSIEGYIGAKPPHLVPKEERKQLLPLDKLFVDTGLAPSVVRNIIEVGDSVSFLGKYMKLQGDLRVVKSLDNRASVACGILVMQELAQRERAFNIYFVATSQEEYTGLGARIHAYRLPIDYGIVVDVSFAEHPDLKDHETNPLGSGPVIGRGATIPEKLSDLLIETAKENDISYQIEPLPTYTGTDAEGIAFSREGIATCVIGIPLRYMHTPVEVVCLKDIQRTKRLIVSYIEKLAEKERISRTSLRSAKS